jgi:hypothetical protein
MSPMNLERLLTRRAALRTAAAGVLAPSLSGWLGVLAARAAEEPRTTKRCILLWMNGGPSHIDTFDIKPAGRSTSEFKPIRTSADGIQVCEHLPKLADLMNHAAVIRSMSTPEGDHSRARFHLHTGYREGVGGIAYPGLGSIASAELGRDDFPLPNFVCINTRQPVGPGYLGPRHQPLVVANPTQGVENLKSPAPASQFTTQTTLLDELEQGFLRRYPAPPSEAHQTTYRRAIRMMLAPEVSAFDLSREPAAVRSAYGLDAAPANPRAARGGASNTFAAGCLMARRLVEVGVPFVEVALDGWDTHQDNFPRTRALCEQLDRPASALIADLRDRGLLDSTLVVWMGEFGRTPQITGRAGRNHYSKAWSTVLFGGGIRGGQVIGRTDGAGARVEERPVSVADFLATVCRTIGIDPRKRNLTPEGRPITLVEKDAKPIDL